MSVVSQTGAGQRVLIVRPTALGDVSRSVPVLVTLRRAWPQARIDWLVSDTFTDVVCSHPDLDRMVVFPRQRFGKIFRSGEVAQEAWAWALQLRHERYDWVFDFQGLFRSGLCTWLTAAKYRVGFANAREAAWLAYNRPHYIDRRLHTVDRMLALLQAEGFSPVHDVQLYLSKQDQQWLDGWLEQNIGSGQTYACMAPTARWLCKCWPIEKYIQIAQRLLRTAVAGERLVILAAPSEQQQIQPLLDALGPSAPVLRPKTSIGQMMALISRARLLLCNDSAALHIAVGFKRPIVAVFGPTDPGLVGPYRREGVVVRPHSLDLALVKKNYRNIRDDQSLINRVEVDRVWGKIMEQLSTKPDDTPPFMAQSNLSSPQLFTGNNSSSIPAQQ